MFKMIVASAIGTMIGGSIIFWFLASFYTDSAGHLKFDY